jgi:hypothetical protein
LVIGGWALEAGAARLGLAADVEGVHALGEEAHDGGLGGWGRGRGRGEWVVGLGHRLMVEEERDGEMKREREM